MGQGKLSLPMDRKKLRGLTALVTGASSGIGLAIARELSARGADLILVSNETARLKELVAAAPGAWGAKARAIPLDLSRRDAAEKLAARLGKTRVDILVNNAGIFFWGEVPDIEPERVWRMLHLHALTPSLLCAHYAREMRRRRAGWILNVSSMIVYKDFPGLAHYGGTKSYLKSFTESLRSEMGEYGVKVSSLRPGAVDTNLYRSSIPTGFARRIGLMLSPEAVARAAVNGLLAGKPVIVPGLLTQIIIRVVPLAPRFLIDFIKRHTRLIPRTKP
ncbi:MAG: SDR family NAD(P)-dependent oxidoreductase [Spirochaetes bacterium]|nr:SDR family NAD(P)-dependent oxidoreductase [Spirochaetota bacterium]